MPQKGGRKYKYRCCINISPKARYISVQSGIIYYTAKRIRQQVQVAFVTRKRWWVLRFVRTIRDENILCVRTVGVQTTCQTLFTCPATREGSDNIDSLRSSTCTFFLSRVPVFVIGIGSPVRLPLTPIHSPTKITKKLKKKKTPLAMLAPSYHQSCKISASTAS